MYQVIKEQQKKTLIEKKMKHNTQWWEWDRKQNLIRYSTDKIRSLEILSVKIYDYIKIYD